MRAKVYVTLKRGVLDPQGRAVARALARLGFDDVKDARIGKYIELEIDSSLAADRPAVAARVEAMCKELLANLIIEEYRFELVEE